MRQSATQLHHAWRRFPSTVTSSSSRSSSFRMAPALWRRGGPTLPLSQGRPFSTRASPSSNPGESAGGHDKSGPAHERRNLSQLVEPVLNGKLDVADLSSKEANQLIWASSKGDKSGRSFQLFDRIKGVHPIYPLSFRYLFISSSHCPERTPELLKELRASGLDTTDLVLGGLLVAMCNQGHTDRAVKIFERMLANSGRVAWFESSVLIAHLIEQGRGADARALYERCGAEYDKLLYYKFLQAAVAHKDFALARYFYQAMGEHHVRLEGRVLETMLSAGLAAHQYQEVYHMAEQVLPTPAASAPLYEILFRALLKDPALPPAEKVARALDYFGRFVEAQLPLPPQSTLLERVLDILAESDDLEQVRAFLQALHAHHYTVPSSTVYRIADKFESRPALTPLILRLLHGAKSSGTPAVRSLVYYKMIGLYAQQGLLAQALRACRDMAYAGLTPSTMVYTQLVAAAGRARDVEGAWAILAQSARERVSLTRPLYNTLVDVALVEHREDLLPALYEDMHAKAIRLDGGPYLDHLLNSILRDELLLSSSSSSSSSSSHTTEDEGDHGNCSPPPPPPPPPTLVVADPPRRTSEQSEAWYGQLKEFFLLLVQGQGEEARAMLSAWEGGAPPSAQAAWIRCTGKAPSASPPSQKVGEQEAQEATQGGPLVMEAHLEVAAHHQLTARVEDWWQRLTAQFPSHSPSLWACESLLCARVQARQPWEQAESLHAQMKQAVMQEGGAEEAQDQRGLPSRAHVALTQAYVDHQQNDKARAFLASQEHVPPAAVQVLLEAYCQQGQREEALAYVLEEVPHERITGEMIRPFLRAYAQEEAALRAVLDRLREEAHVPLSELAAAFPSPTEARAFLHASHSQGSQASPTGPSPDHHQA